MIVYDRYGLETSRDIDPVNGYLRVSMSNLTKAQVRPYLGMEIPDWEDFGLKPKEIYNVLCPEDELEKAAPTFNNLPLTRDHVAVSVDDVPKERIVGSLGDHAVFESPYIKNNLIVYDKKDIDLIMSGKKKELSCGYRYTPVRESGEYNGQHYDFKMTNIIGNHVALVKQGRAGRDVMVADSSKGILEVIKEKVMAVFDNDLVGDEFKESEHPRAKNGQFTSVGGSSGSSKKMFAVKSSEGYERKFNNKEEAEKWISSKLEPIYGKERSELKELRDKQYKVEEVDAEEFKDLIDGSEKTEESKAVSEGKKEQPALKEDISSLSDEELSKRYAEYTKKIIPLMHEGLKKEKDSDEYKEIQGKIKSLMKENDDIATEREKRAKKQSVLIRVNGKTDDLTEDKASAKIDSKKVINSQESETKGEKEMAEEIKNENIEKLEAEEKSAKEEKPLEKKKEEIKKEEKPSEEPVVEDKPEEEKLEEKKEDEEPTEDSCGKKEVSKDEDKKEEPVVEAKEEKKEEIEDEETEEVKEEIKEDKKEEKKEEEKEEMAKDSALVMDADALRAEGRKEAMEDFKARDVARKSVRSIVGDVDVFAFDSDEEIYKFACEKAGMDLTDVASFKDAFKGLQAGRRVLAMDATPVRSGNEECFENIRVID